MNIDAIGGRVTVDEFWDCECDTNYIHRKITDIACSFCGATMIDMPDSMLDEILIYNGDSLDQWERAELVGFLTEEVRALKTSRVIELTDVQNRQVDIIHNAAYNAMCEVLVNVQEKTPEWNMEWIGEICDCLADIAWRYFGKTEMEVYPSIGTE